MEPQQPQPTSSSQTQRHRRRGNRERQTSSSSPSCFVHFRKMGNCFSSTTPAQRLSDPLDHDTRYVAPSKRQVPKPGKVTITQSKSADSGTASSVNRKSRLLSSNKKHSSSSPAKPTGSLVILNEPATNKSRTKKKPTLSTHFLLDDEVKDDDHVLSDHQDATENTFDSTVTSISNHSPTGAQQGSAPTQGQDDFSEMDRTQPLTPLSALSLSTSFDESYSSKSPPVPSSHRPSYNGSKLSTPEPSELYFPQPQSQHNNSKSPPIPVLPKVKKSSGSSSSSLAASSGSSSSPKRLLSSSSPKRQRDEMVGRHSGSSSVVSRDSSLPLSTGRRPDSDSLSDMLSPKREDTSSGADQPVNAAVSCHPSPSSVSSHPMRSVQQHPLALPPDSPIAAHSAGAGSGNSSTHRLSGTSSRAFQSRLLRSRYMQKQQQAPPSLCFEEEEYADNGVVQVPTIIETSSPPRQRHYQQQPNNEKNVAMVLPSRSVEESILSMDSCWASKEDGNNEMLTAGSRYRKQPQQTQNGHLNNFLKSTTVSESMRMLQMSNEDFEASLNQSLIWAHQDISALRNSSDGPTSTNNSTNKDTVWAVALSRHCRLPPSSNHFQQPYSQFYDQPPAESSNCWLWQTPPPLFMAVGTETGILSVSQLLDETPQLHRPADGGANADKTSPQRLSAPSTLQRPGRIRSLDFCPVPKNTGKASSCWLACGGDDGSCALIFVSTGPDSKQEDGTLRPGPHLQVMAEIHCLDRIYSVQFSPNGHILAIGGYDETVSLVDVSPPTKSMMVTSSRSRTDSLPCPAKLAEIPVNGLIGTLDWSPDGSLLAIGGTDKVCTLVDGSGHSNFAVLQDIKCHAGVTCVQWHPQGHLLAVGCANSSVYLVDRATFTLVQELSFGGNDNGGFVTSTSLLDLNLSHHRRSSSFSTATNASNGNGGSVRINSLCWSPTMGHYLVVCTTTSNNNMPSSLSSTKLLETKSYSIIQELPVRATGVINSVVWGQVASTSASLIPPKYLVMGGNDGKALILKAGVDVMMHNQHRAFSQSAYSSSCQFGGGGVGGNSSVCGVLSTIGDESTSGNGGGDGGGVFSGFPAGDHRHHHHRHPIGGGYGMGTTGRNNDWILRNQVFREVEDELQVDKPETAKHPEWIHPVFATGENVNDDDAHYSKKIEDMDDAMVNLSPSKKEVLTPGPVALKTVAFSRGSKSRRSAFFAVASAEHASVTVRSTVASKSANHPSQEPPEWNPLCQLDFLDPITCLAFSNGSRILACASLHNNHVHIVGTSPAWVVVTVAKVPVSHGGGAHAMAFSKNNERLAVLGTDGVLRILDPHDEFSCCREIMTPTTGDDAALVHSTCFDWSSKYLAVGHEDGTVCLYHSTAVLDSSVSPLEKPAESFRQQQALKAIVVTTQPTPVRTVAIGPNSRFLAVGGDDGILTILCRNTTACFPAMDEGAGDWLNDTPSYRHPHERMDELPNNLSEDAPIHKKSSHICDTWVMVHRVSTIDFSIAQLKWSPSGRHIAVLGQNKELKVIDTVFWSEVEEVTAFTMNHAHHKQGNVNDDDMLSWPQNRTLLRSIGSVSFSQDGKWLAIAEDPECDGNAYNHCGGKIRVLNTLTWDLVLRVPLLADEALDAEEEDCCDEAFPDEHGEFEQPRVEFLDKKDNDMSAFEELDDFNSETLIYGAAAVNNEFLDSALNNDNNAGVNSMPADLTAKQDQLERSTIVASQR